MHIYICMCVYTPVCVCACHDAHKKHLNAFAPKNQNEPCCGGFDL